MVHEQLKALSTPGSKKRRRSVVTPVLDMDDPLFLPASPLAIENVVKKKPKKSASLVTTPAVKKASKGRNMPATTAGGTVPPATKKATSK